MRIAATVENPEQSIAWYSRVLGMQPRSFGEGRQALHFGQQKINLHPADGRIEPRATHPTPGSADLCVISATPLEEIQRHLATLDVEVESGPVPRAGASGPITSLYIRDPDGNLVEVSTYDHGRLPAPDPYDLLPSVPSLAVRGDGVKDGGWLPDVMRHTSAGGSDVNPGLTWDPYPDAQSYAITCFDPDAPTGSGFWHWLAIDLPADVTAIAQGAADGQLPAGARQLRNDFGQSGYGGAAPPPDDPPHRYLFCVHALDMATLEVGDEASAAYTGFMLTAHTIARGTLCLRFGHEVQTMS
jgi:Raf kinase inhibitor-like YbhB/YbcL family protein